MLGLIPWPRSSTGSMFREDHVGISTVRTDFKRLLAQLDAAPTAGIKRLIANVLGLFERSPRRNLRLFRRRAYKLPPHHRVHFVQAFARMFVEVSHYVRGAPLHGPMVWRVAAEFQIRHNHFVPDTYRQG